MPEMHAAHDRHAGHSVASFRETSFGSVSSQYSSGFLVNATSNTGPLDYRAPSFPGSNLIAPILGTVVFVYWRSCFRPLGLWGELRDRKPGDDDPYQPGPSRFAFGTSLRSKLSVCIEVEGLGGELASLITVMLLGSLARTASYFLRPRGALNALAALLPDTAEACTG